jgi:hypothetical protein
MPAPAGVPCRIATAASSRPQSQIAAIQCRPAQTHDVPNRRQHTMRPVFLVLKGPRRGQPLSAKGMDETLAAARRRRPA